MKKLLLALLATAMFASTNAHAAESNGNPVNKVSAVILLAGVAYKVIPKIYDYYTEKNQPKPKEPETMGQKVKTFFRNTATKLLPSNLSNWKTMAFFAGLALTGFYLTYYMPNNSDTLLADTALNATNATCPAYNLYRSNDICPAIDVPSGITISTASGTHCTGFCNDPIWGRFEGFSLEDETISAIANNAVFYEPIGEKEARLIAMANLLAKTTGY